MNPTLYGVAAIVMWASTGVFVAISATVPSLQALTMSWFIGAACLASYYGWKKENLIAHFRRPLADYLFVGLGVGVYTILIFSAFRFAPPFEVHILNYLWPILLMVFLSIFQKMPMGIVKIIGVLLGFGGCFLLFAYRYNDSSFDGIHAGHFMALAAAIIWALYSCFAKGRDYPYAFMIPIFLIAGIVCLVGHLLLETWTPPDAKAWFAIVVLGITRIAYVFWDYSMREGDQVLITSLSYLIPLFSTVLMIAFGFGASSVIVGVSGFLIVAGCLLINGSQLKDTLFRRFKNK